ncbi:hypothetical protein ACIBH1_05350 [Nonomuraea sp. NPDC050663]|uniref:hypothetical protein n=1 Tax=Nonomuraea sp. NPDC050663 TaxID=3364370 RepID=UPI00379A9D1D
MFKRFSRPSRRGHQPDEAGDTMSLPSEVASPASPPGRFWAIGVLVLAALVSMSMNTWHAWTATSLPKGLAILYGVSPVALAAMQSHAVALRALRKEKVGAFRRTLTFGLVLGGLGLSFLGIYDLLRHAVPDPLPGVPLHEPAVFFSIVIDLMALAALHELLRESPSFVHAAQASETTTVVVPEAVPTSAEEKSSAEVERVIEAPAVGSTIVELEATTSSHEEGPLAVPAVVAETATTGAERVVETAAITSGDAEVIAPLSKNERSVPDPVEAVPPQVGDLVADGNLMSVETIPAPVFSHQVQPGAEVEEEDPLAPVAVAKFLPDVVEGYLPSVRKIKTTMTVGTDRARNLQGQLKQLIEVSR